MDLHLYIRSNGSKIRSFFSSQIDVKKEELSVLPGARTINGSLTDHYAEMKISFKTIKEATHRALWGCPAKTPANVHGA
eukprot:scaffold27030_cov132-Cylindrotheca_fusiformis.AAC.2